MKKFVSIILCLAFCLGMVTTNVFATNKQSVEDGLYTLKNVSSGYMLNVYAGKDANGTKVTTWKFDGTTDQQIYIQHQGNGKYLLQFKASSVGRVIDVNRGESLTAPLDNGDGIDIWTANDLDAQYFYINSCDDGSYTFELIAKPNHVISAVSSSAAASNGTQLQLKQFKDADYQKWYLCDLNGCIVQSKEDNGTQKCSHNITSKQLLSVERKAAGEREYHNVVEIYSVKCEDCGISLDNEKVFIQESHIDGFDEDNICTYCDEPIICAHQFTKEATNEEITPLNADQHMVNLEKYEYCSGCGDKLLIFESYTSGEPHNFKGNTCSDCGYEKCSHSKTYKVKKSSEVKQCDEQHHVITEVYDMICNDCGTTVKQNKSTDNKETHSGSTCASCGYSKPFQNKSAWVATTGTSRLILRTGPSTSYSELCRMSRGSEVIVTGEKENGFYPVTYQQTSGWASGEWLTFTKPTTSSNIADKLGQRIANVNSYTDGIVGECVWYVRGRALEKIGARTGIYGNANQWWSLAKAKGLATGATVKSDSIACFNGGSYGHVIYVEEVVGNNVYYTEANVQKPYSDGKISSLDGVLKVKSISAFTSGSYQGCIYLK